MKAQTVEDGSKQRDINQKDQDGFFLSLGIDARKNRFVTTSDVAGEFLKAGMVDHAIFKLHGPSIEALTDMDKEKYLKYITLVRNRKVLYVKVLKDMNGTLNAPLLWHNTLSRTLIEERSSISPNAPCVANKVVDDTHLTIYRYVDDLHISCKDSTVVKTTITMLGNIFGKIYTTYGIKHNYLGMDVCFKNLQVTLIMS